MKHLLKRQNNMIDYLISSLLKKRGKNLALLLAYSLIVFLIGSVMFFSNAIREEGSILLEEAPDIVVQRRTAGRHDLLPSRYAERIAGMEGVASAKARLWGYYYDPVTGANYTLLVPNTSPPGQGEIVIGEGVSRSRLAFKDDTLEFKDSRGNLVNYQVKETLSRGSERVSSDLILMSERDFRGLSNIPDHYHTDLTIRLRAPAKRAEIEDRIKTLFPDTVLISRSDILATVHDSLSWQKGLKVAVLAGMLIALLILAWDKASGLGEEEKKEIGILKAIGWQSSDVLLLKLWEGLGISVSSFLLGILFAYAHVFLASSALFEPVLKGWAVLYPDFKLIPSIDPLQVSVLFLLAVIPYTLATVLPVLKAATVDPDAVMRS